MGTKADARNVRLAKRRREAQVKRYLSIAGMVAGAVLIAAAVISLRSGGSAQPSSFDYEPDDISYDKPIQAVHEVDLGFRVSSHFRPN